MKTNKFLKFGAICFASLSLFACEITELPYTSVTDEELAKNPDAVEAVTLGSYSQLKGEVFQKAYHYAGEYGGDNISLSGTTTDALMYLYNHQRTVDNGHLANQWGIFYKIIINCNNTMTLAKEGTSPKLDHVLGENYFLRGWIYFQLVTSYGKAYHIASDADLGVPVKLDIDPLNFPDRMPVKQVYQQIIKDLEKADELMSSSGINKSAIYANAAAAKALLSRVYLFMHDYANAEKYASEVIATSGKRLMSQGELGTWNEFIPESNPEAIFANKRVKDIDIKNNGFYDVGSMYATIDGAGWGELYASESYRNLIDMYPEDIRNNFVKPQYLDNTMELEYIAKEHLFGGKVADDPLLRNYFRYNAVRKVGDKWVILKKGAAGNTAQEDANCNAKLVFKTQEVLVDADGKMYVEVAQTNGEITSAYYKYPVKIQQRMQRRNDYPKYFMYKCSYQEQQTHLWSTMIIRLSEMYMNRAEARIYQGNTGGAIEDINTIKLRAGIPAYNPAVDGEDLLTAYLDERRREFALESMRKHDLFRNNVTIDRTYPGGHDRGSETAVVQYLKVTDNAAVNFIPKVEIEAYLPKVLPQNP